MLYPLLGSRYVSGNSISTPKFCLTILPSMMVIQRLSSNLSLHHPSAKIDKQDVFPIIISRGNIFGMLYLTALKRHD